MIFNLSRNKFLMISKTKSNCKYIKFLMPNNIKNMTKQEFETV